MTSSGDELSELMRRYGLGEDAAFESLYGLLAPRLYRFCLRLSGHSSDAEDLLQETFLRLHRARATYQSRANVVHWAFAIARSVYIDKLRYRSRRPESLGSANDVAEAHELQGDERYRPDAVLLASAVWRVATHELAKMSERNRMAYILLKEEGLSVTEAAALLGTTAYALRKRASRAYAQLQKAIDALN